MNEWKEKALSSLIEIIGGGTPKTAVADYWNGDIPWLSVVDFNNGLKYVYETEKTITEKGLNESSTKYLFNDDIILSARGTVGALAMLSKPMTFNQSCYGLRGKTGTLLNSYLYYLLKDSLGQLESQTYGAVFDTITKQSFDNIIVKIPPLPEQEAIAEVLSGLDDKIDLLQRNNNTLEQMAETLFRQWFVEEAVSMTTLSEYIVVQPGFAFKSNDFIDEGTNGVLKIKNISFDFVDIQKTQYIPDNVAIKINQRFEVKSGAFLIAMTGAEIGKIGIVCRTERKLFLNQRVGMLVDKIPGSAIIGYLLLKSNDGQDYINNTGSGSAQPNISTEAIEKMIVPYQSPRVVTNIVKMLKPLFDKKIQNLAQIQQLETLRDTLLPKLMSGTVKVNSLVTA